MRILRVGGAMAVACLALSTEQCGAALRYTGVNLAGAEFGISNGNVNLPGVYGTHYTYPTAAEVDYYVGKGMNTFRLAIRWERIQREQFADFNATELARLDGFVNYATSKGAQVIIEPHNFQRYYPAASNFQSSPQGLVGSDVPDAAFADFWSRMATEYRDNGRVIFNLMNEPNSMPTAQLVTSENAAIAAIRQAGAGNLILVPGNQWTGAWAWNATWYNGPNSVHMLNIVDPANNFAFDVHQYLDDNASGTSAQIGTNANPNNINIGVERLTSFTNWLHANNRRGFLGEFAVANSRIGDGTSTQGPRIGDETINAMLDYMEANSDVWLGWAWWAGGPWWGNYMFTLEPTSLSNPVDRPAMTVLDDRLAGPMDDVPGDFNLDGVVDGGDLPLWLLQSGQTGLALAADADLDGDVDGADFLTWQSGLGAQIPPATAHGSNVPEPAAIALLVAPIAAAARRHRTSRH